jgi:hypothetical protein
MHAAVQGTNGRSDFDFLIGRWHVDNRRLRERLAGSTDWEEFAATSTVVPILGGFGNFDEITFKRATGTQYGATVRLFDSTSQQWRIYWAGDSSGGLDVPLVGSFTNGCGAFYAQELFAGRAIFSRFIWMVLSEDTCRWEQAFSADGGQTWETNWTMDFTRTHPQQ